ncbi:peptide-methionine (R)-S-oxide reductase [Candidatus Kaiserbacteria bacterium CG10_big_fil_rev_8_21_14_0_10_56_12]|uniref:peptide-methionine (R)-S-oxide reductase n=1 Tax=Candidatus Kaiserbacteria bacterium CG10_big_fil_rev_8_21_14_0_10_56_12 TaxID=1974611 RepID=A0A2H0UAY0_9BACT|nr:MAG: peptide-methionine (R)-S-oxide reductase [Candidatus Kaiserbacteria bacterium CG10_big_fil_rev_8_21_14_0_10_56_12]
MDIKKDEELSQELKKVARQKGTEAPFSGKYVHEKAAGTYKCSVCGNPLFSSEKKFDATVPGLQGWPSFDDAIPWSVEFRPDDSEGMQRTEVVCMQCKAHLGHVFEGAADAPSGKHYCINSVCLDLERK